MLAARLLSLLLLLRCNTIRAASPTTSTSDFSLHLPHVLFGDGSNRRSFVSSNKPLTSPLHFRQSADCAPVNDQLERLESTDLTRCPATDDVAAAVDANASARLREYINMTKDNVSNVAADDTSDSEGNASMKVPLACDNPRLDEEDLKLNRAATCGGIEVTLKSSEPTIGAAQAASQVVVDDSTAPSASSSASMDSSSSDVNASKSPPPPPIATFEEWTKERLSHKERRPATPPQDAAQMAATATDAASGSSGDVGGSASRADAAATTQPQQTSNSPSQAAAQPQSMSPIVVAPADASSPSLSASITNNALVNGGSADEAAARQQQTLATSTQLLATPIALIVDPPLRNYASFECGAKVLHSNDGAEHRNAILNDRERDEYVRTPCHAQNKFLIIELCETIQPTYLEMANFELFSSGPHEVRISMSERYPTADWATLGHVLAADTREMQAFRFASTGSYAKFIRLELLSHHGREHYCTLSSVRISGVSIVDEYEAEAASEGAASYATPPVSQPPQPLTPLAIVESTAAPVPIDAQMSPAILAPLVDPSNESGDAAAEKTREDVLMRLNHIVDANIGELTKAIGKTFMGRRAASGSPTQIAFNSCNFHCWLYDDVFWQQTYWSCYLFDLRFDTTRAGRRARAKQHKNFASTLAALNTATTRRRSRAQNAFLRTLKEFKIVRAPAKQNASEIVKPIDAAQPKEAADRVLVQPTTSETRSSQQPSANEAAQSSHQAPTIASQQQAAAVQKSATPSSLPGTSSTHKESIFLKLNKRLAALELNMSLSSEYLSELSRRYVAQQDGYTRQHERDVKSLETMVQHLGEQMQSTWSAEVQNLRSELSSMTRQMQEFIAKTLTLNTQPRIPPPFDFYAPGSTSTSTQIVSRAPLNAQPLECHQECYKMLPASAPLPSSLPSEKQDAATIEASGVCDYNDDRRSASAYDAQFWSNEQLLAVIFVSNMSTFTLLTAGFLVYKVWQRALRQRAQLVAAMSAAPPPFVNSPPPSPTNNNAPTI